MSHAAPLYRLIAFAAIAALLASCSATATAPESAAVTPSAAPSATATPAPTATPAAWTFPAGSTIVGVDVGGRTPAEATARVAAVLDEASKPIPLLAEGLTVSTTVTIDPALVRATPDAAALVADAEKQAQSGSAVTLPWAPTIDSAALEAALTAAAPVFHQDGASEIVTDTEALTRTFTFRERPGADLDIPATSALIENLLLDPSQTLSDTVVLAPTFPERDLAQLEQVLQEHLTYWKNGVGAIYVKDLETGKTLGINQDTVFSGASVMKVPIMIYVYSKLGKLDDQQHDWMENVIINSDNLDANALLAAAVGGQGTEAALEGVNEMTTMLQGLGLKHTYQLIPYESAQWLIQQAKFPKGGPAREGAAPFTAADKYLRTTPREMGELFVMLAECGAGAGPLIEKYGDTISEALCDEMIGWLEQPHDQERMVAGIPADVPVAHKGGWIDDMQSDVGIVSSPNGRYVASIYIWRRDGYATNPYASPSPYLGDFSHTVYTFFNPEPME